MRLVAIVVVWMSLGGAGFASGEQADLVATTEARTPENERAAFHLPPGFEAQLVASEPAINKPMNLAFDDRGRLWVTSTVEYPYPANPGTKARDRVIILDEIGDDGKARKVSTFADGLNIPIGLLPIGRGDSALVHSIPAIRRLTDTNGDGKADQFEEVYTSFGFRDTHGMTNAFTWGDDGWIYATHGFSNESTVKGSDGRPIRMQSGNTYRMRADGTHVEYVSHGQVNPFGLAFDPIGNLYSADCHSRPIYCLLPGAFYPSFGKPDDGIGFGPEMMTHDHGSTGIAGIVHYSADAFPPDFRENLFIGNVVTSRINRDMLKWTGASPAGITQPDFLVSDDPWFRPVDLKLGPDGAMYVADFYNRIIGHYEVPLTHPGRDRERGRIWRIVYRGSDGKANAPAPSRRDLTTTPLADLMSDLGNPNRTVRVKATNELVRRGRDVAASTLKATAVDSNPIKRVHVLWALQRLESLDRSTLANAIDSGDPVVRTHGLRIVGERSGGPEELGIARGHLADASPFARRAAAESLAKHPMAENIRPLIDAIRETPAPDTHLKHATRIALREQLRSEKDWGKALGGLDESARRLVADVAPGIPTPEAAAFLAAHLAAMDEQSDAAAQYLRHVARFGREPEQSAVAGLIARAKDLTDRVALLKAVQEGEQARGSALPGAVAELANETGRTLLASRDADGFGLVVDLVGALKLAGFAGPLGALVADPASPLKTREEALSALASIGPATTPAVASVLSDASAPEPLRRRAASALATANRPEAFEALILALPTAPGSLQGAIATSLAQSPTGTSRLLDAISVGKASTRLLQDRSVSVRLDASNVAGIKEQVAGLLKGLPPAEERIQTLIAQRRAKFDPAQADRTRGLAVFEKNCAACHQLDGRGARVGPQLDGVGIRGADRLLEDILDPNRNVDQAFRSTHLDLKDGRSISGLVLREEGAVLVLADAQGKDVRIARADIEGRLVSQLSPMPANWSDHIPETEFADLLAFLLNKKPDTGPVTKP